jgi:FkbM family methyltransferase
MNYQYKVPFKTKVLNIPRRVFKWGALEQFLSRNIQPKSNILKRFVPPEYLYEKGSWRTSDRNGVRMNLDISNVVDHEIYFNLYDCSFGKYLDKLKHVETFWDIGANIGWTALQVNSKFPETQIIAFEPSSKNRKRLKENISLNKANIKVEPYGLGNEPSNFKLYSVLENNPGMNRIMNDEKALPYETIEVITADSFWENSGRPKVDALKLDVEGFEMFVLKGMDKMISTCKPAMFIEVNDDNLTSNGFSATYLLKWLNDRAYVIHDAQSEKKLQPPFENLLPHFDIVAK